MEVPWAAITRAARNATWTLPRAIREDAYQEAILAAWRASSRFDPAQMSLHLYLLRYARWAAKACLRNWLVAKQGQDLPHFISLDDVLQPLFTDPRASLDLTLYCKQLLSTLTPSQREIVFDTYWEGFTGDESAAKRHYSAANLHFHQRRILKLLRKAVRLTP